MIMESPCEGYALSDLMAQARGLVSVIMTGSACAGEEAELRAKADRLTLDLLKRAILFRERNKYEAALDAGCAALEVLHAIDRGEGKRAAQVLSDIGYVRRVLRMFPEADAALTKALELRRKLYAIDHPTVAESLDRLAMLKKDQGEFDQAEILCMEGLRVRVNVLGEDHPLTGASKHNLAIIRERGAGGV
jgi:tetratricopeptide (TPR) repeat protein